MGAAARSRRPERDAHSGEADHEPKGGEPRPPIARSEKAAEQEDEDGLGAHHQRHVGARGQRRRLGEQHEGNDLADQREREEFGPQPRSRSRPDLARDRARQQHRGGRHAHPREREIERIEGARGDLDQKKGRAPEEGQKGQPGICGHEGLKDWEGRDSGVGWDRIYVGSQDALGSARSTPRLLHRHFTGAP